MNAKYEEGHHCLVIKILRLSQKAALVLLPKFRFPATDMYLWIGIDQIDAKLYVFEKHIDIAGAELIQSGMPIIFFYEVDNKFPINIKIGFPSPVNYVFAIAVFNEAHVLTKISN